MPADRTRASLLEQWDVLARADPPDGDAAALAAGVELLTAALAAPTPSARPVAATRFYARPRPEPTPPRTPFPAAVTAARGALEHASDDRVVDTPVGPMTLVDLLATRCVEAVVGGLALPVPVSPERGALRVAVRLLARTLAASHPGRSVEVRVPPYVAVQCLTGPRHTRGTPPNVVEADPIAFVEVACGRRSWASAVTDGSVRASGERADLSDVLPVRRQAG